MPQSPTFETYGKQTFMPTAHIAELLGVTATTIYRQASDLHRLTRPPTTSILFSSRYIQGLVASRQQSPPGRTLPINRAISEFATTLSAHNLIVETEQAYKVALQERLEELGNGNIAIRTSSIISLLSVSTSAVNKWIKRDLLTPFTKSGDPHPGTAGVGAFFLEQPFRQFCEWQTPALYLPGRFPTNES